MKEKRVTIKEAIKFHGHLGPWLVLGLLAGEYIVNKLQTKKHFGLKIKTYGLNKKPKSCMLDGLQLSTGCTLGKFNLLTTKAKSIKISCFNKKTKKRLIIRFRNEFLKSLNALKNHKDSEDFAHNLYKENFESLIQ